MATAKESSNVPRPTGLTLEIADALRHIEANYEREGSGPGSRFEGRLLEDVQAEWVMRELHAQADRFFTDTSKIRTTPAPIRLCSVCGPQCRGQWLT